jgi:predicted nucleic acid-binding protein
MVQLVSDVRRHNRLKLPDAIIAATALQNKAILVTEDKAFSRRATLRHTKVRE